MEHSLVASFANRLNSICPLDIRPVPEQGLSLEEGDVFICSTSCLIREKNKHFFLESTTPATPTYNPQIDLLFESFVPYSDQVTMLCILLTGIGEDGARGMLKLREKGVHTIAESESSAIVYGMPRSACEMGAAAECIPLNEIIEAILLFDRRHV